MARGSWIYDAESGRLLPKGEFLALKAMRAPRQRSALSAPLVIGAMPAIKSMADGQYYDDKRSYYKSVARAGCEIVGYDKNWTDYVKQPYDEKTHEAEIVEDVKKAIEQASSLPSTADRKAT
jgi:hypothetical protein